jgi:hypothetical protein
MFVLGFNPWSLEGVLRHLPRRDSVWGSHYISSYRLTEWLNLLKLETEFSGAFLLSTAETILKPQSLLDQSKAYLAPVYAIRAIKRTYTMIPIKPAWLTAPGLLTNHAVGSPIFRKKSG